MQYYTFRKLAAKEYKESWLIQHFLPNTGWFLLIGQAGIGKSTFAVQLCDALEKGEPFLEKPTMRVKCCYIQADSTEHEWQQQIQRIAPESTAGTIVDVPRNILSTPEQVVLLERFLEKINPGFTVWDSLYKLSNANTNTNAILNPIGVIETLTKGTPFLVIHHPTKDSMGGVHGSSGHNSLSAACSVHLTLKKRKLTIDKGRLIEQGDIGLHKDSQGLWHLDTGMRRHRQDNALDIDISDRN